MKKILFILLTVLLSSTTGAAQTKITQATFDSLVDYVNCKYTYEYISEYIKRIKAKQKHTPSEKKDMDSYDKIINPELEYCTIGNHLAFDKLKELLLRDSVWKDTYNNITDKINKKKSQFDENEPHSSIIELLITLESTGIPSEIEGKIPLTVKNNIREELKRYIEPPPLPPPTPTPANGNTSIKNFWNKWSWEICCIIIIVAVSFILLFICLWQRSSHKRIEKIIKRLLLYNNKFELEQPAEQYAEILTHIQNDLNECKRKTDELEILREKLTQIQDDLNKYKRIDEPEEIRIEENTGNGTPDTDANSNTETIQSVADNSSGIQYVKLKQNDGFYQLSSESGGCDFKIFNIRGNTADFEFCGNKSNALAKQYIFDNVCEIVYRSAAPKDIVNVEKGMVTMTESGNWKVTNRAKIRFE